MEIVGTKGEEIALFGDGIASEHSGGHFDHGAAWNVVDNTEISLLFEKDLLDLTQLTEIRDEGEENFDGSKLVAAQERTELRAKPLGLLQ